MKITPLAALSDNYIWLIEQQGKAIIVDPGEAAPVLDYIQQQHLQPVALLLTHNHADHTDGVAELKAHFPELPVYGPQETAMFAEQIVQDGDCFTLDGLNFEVIKSGGHTAGHISYLLNGEKLLCGDALFSAGCGRVFTGDYQAQFDALQRFRRLPDFVEIYPAHEYTQSNLAFAAAVMPQNCAVAEYQERADMLRKAQRPTLPTTIAIEKQINPFLTAENLETFIALRKQKDNF